MQTYRQHAVCHEPSIMQLQGRCSPMLALACDYENVCAAESKAQNFRSVCF